MNLKPVSLAVLALLLVAALLTGGCNLNAAPEAEELPGVGSEDEMMQQLAEENTEAMTATPDSAEPTPAEQEGEPTEVVQPTPTTAVAEPTPVAPTPTPLPTVAPPSEPTQVPEPTQEPVVGTEPRVHVVQAGENLFRIALRYGKTVEALAQANGITNPALIYVGQELSIPPAGTTPAPSPSPGGGTGGVHVVQAGENLFRIALKYNYNYLYLAQYNGISNPNFLAVGQEIQIP